MKKFYLLEDVETNKYFGTYRCDDYWTSDIEDSKKFFNTDDFEIDEQTIDFLSGKIVKIVEFLEFN